MKTEDRVDYFLDAFQVLSAPAQRPVECFWNALCNIDDQFQVSLDKFHTKAQEVFWPIESTKQDPPTIVKQQQEQTIVYAASIRQVILRHY